MEKGFNDFLAKPIDISKLDEILDRWISKEKREERKKTREGKKLVLLVDGNPANLRLGISALEEKYDVATAPSMEKMVRLLESNSPDLILMNEGMRDSLSLPAELHIIFMAEPFDSTTLAACVENYFDKTGVGGINGH